MNKILAFLLLTVALAFAGETTSPKDTVILKPSKEQLAKATPLNNTICPVSNSKIGGMGMAIPVIYKGKIINLCCGGCPANFAKDPDKFLKIAQDEVAKNAASASKK